MVAQKKVKKTSESINSRLQLVIKSGACRAVGLRGRLRHSGGSPRSVDAAALGRPPTGAAAHARGPTPL